MARSEPEVIHCELLQNILDQPRSIEAVSAYQLGEGRGAMHGAADAVGKANQIVMSGMGSSLFACTPLSYYLSRRGVAASVIEASELFHYHVEVCRPGSIVILLSRSGETIEVTKLLPVLKEKQVTVIGVTNVPNSTLARESDYPILVHSFADQLVAVQTYVGTIVTLLLLGARIAGDSESRWEQAIAALTRALSSFIPDCVDLSNGWREFLNGAEAIYLLGRGPSLGSVSEGTLLFHEVAKAPASAMSAAHFRHGPVEVVSGAFRAIVFATQTAARDLDVALASDIAGMGGNARVIGTGEIDARLRFCSWPDGVPEALTPVVEIVPVQIAALRLAEWRGITPGDFRFAPEVTLTESGFAPIAKGRA